MTRVGGGARAWVFPVLVRPRLWPVAVTVALRLARSGWWRRWPPLPLPDPGYLRFRLVTNYGGDGSGPPEGDDVVRYLEWCRRALRRDG